MPGERTFYLQVTGSERTVSVVLEKAQAQALADGLTSLLDEWAPDAPGEPVDLEALAMPLDEEFRVGALGVAWDPDDQVVVVEVQAIAEDGAQVEPFEDAVDGPAALRIRMLPQRWRAFAERTTSVVSAGRPTCPFCLRPLDPGGHICPRANGFLRRG